MHKMIDGVIILAINSISLSCSSTILERHNNTIIIFRILFLKNALKKLKFGPIGVISDLNYDEKESSI